MKTFKHLLTEKKKYVIRKAGDGYSINGPMKPGQKYHDAPQIKSGGPTDNLFDTHDQAAKHVKSIGGEVLSEGSGTDLDDKIFRLLSPLPEFKRLPMDKQGSIIMKITRMIKK
jgi:hypothetical protein